VGRWSIRSVAVFHDLWQAFERGAILTGTFALLMVGVDEVLTTQHQPKGYLLLVAVALGSAALVLGVAGIAGDQIHRQRLEAWRRSGGGRPDWSAPNWEPSASGLRALRLAKKNKSAPAPSRPQQLLRFLRYGGHVERGKTGLHYVTHAPSEIDPLSLDPRERTPDEVQGEIARFRADPRPAPRLPVVQITELTASPGEWWECRADRTAQGVMLTVIQPEGDEGQLSSCVVEQSGCEWRFHTSVFPLARLFGQDVDESSATFPGNFGAPLPLRSGTYRVTWTAEYGAPLFGAPDSRVIYDGTLKC
jgi:hypothetical protein